MLTTLVGLAAAVLTSLSNLPQVLKVWRTGETADLSRRMLFTLAGGVALWVAYGLLQGDIVIVLANSVSLALAAALIAMKLRDD
jgi:MtN3 and saliva related transmembrane protein